MHNFVPFRITSAIWYKVQIRWKINFHFWSRMPVQSSFDIDFHPICDLEAKFKWCLMGEDNWLRLTLFCFSIKLLASSRLHHFRKIDWHLNHNSRRQSGRRFICRTIILIYRFNSRGKPDIAESYCRLVSAIFGTFGTEIWGQK